MKKKILTLFLIISLVSSLFVSVKASWHDPYEGFRCINYDETTCTTNRVSYGGIGNSGYNEVYTYKNVDFGSNGAYAVTVETGTSTVYAGAVINLYIDSVENKPIATFTARASDWGDPLAHYVELRTKVTGVHSVLLKTGNSPTDFYSIRFHEVTSAEDSYNEYQEAEDPFADIASSKYREDIILLWELGLIKSQDDEMYYPEILTTRGKFIETIVNCITEKVPESEEQVFADVTPESEYFDEINYAKKAGLINGTSHGVFCPDDFILTRDAVAIVCRMLGYEAIVDMDAEYSKRYTKVANKYDILDELDVSNYLTRASMAKLIRNAINAPYLDISAIGADGAEYIPNKDGILSLFHNIYYGEGLISANNITSVSQHDSGVKGNYVKINGEDYNADESPARTLLGYECTYYYKVENDEKTIISIHPQPEVKVTELLSDVHGIESVTADNVIYYDENDKKKKVEIGNDCYILYNGVAADDALSDLITTDPFRGKIRFVKNSNSKNTLMIDEYKNIIIGNSSKRDSFIYDELGKKKYSFDDDFVYIYKNGKPSSYSELKEGDVAMVYESKNKSGNKLFRIYVSDATATGEVTVISEDKITINGNTYKKSLECVEKISPGDNITVKINSAREIVAIDKSEISSYAVAWLLDCETYSDSAFSSTSKIRVIDTDNEIREYTLAQSAWVDGVRYKDGNVTLSSKMNDAPIRYRLNTNGEIVEMDTIVQKADNDKDCLIEAFPQTSSMEYNSSSRLISSNTTGLAVAIMSEEAKIMSRFEDAVDPEDYCWIKSLPNEGVTCRAYSFDFSQGYIDVLVQSVQSTKRSTSNAFVFDRRGSTLNKDGDVCDIVYGYEGGKEVSYILSDKYPELKHQFKVLKKGDFVTVWADNAGDPLGMKVIYFCGGDESRTYNYDGTKKVLQASLHSGVGISQGARQYYSGEKYVYGEVVERNGKYLKILLEGTGETDILDIGNNSVIRYAPEAGQTMITNNLASGNVVVGDIVVAEVIYRSTQTIYIVN